MRALVFALAFVAASCASTPARPGATYVAEDVQHVVTIAVVDPGLDADAIDVALDTIRTAPGNLAVLLLHRGGVWTIVAEWRSQTDARRWSANGEEFQVQFEAARFEETSSPDVTAPAAAATADRRRRTRTRD